METNLCGFIIGNNNLYRFLGICNCLCTAGTLLIGYSHIASYCSQVASYALTLNVYAILV